MLYINDKQQSKRRKEWCKISPAKNLRHSCSDFERACLRVRRLLFCFLCITKIIVCDKIVTNADKLDHLQSEHTHEHFMAEVGKKNENIKNVWNLSFFLKLYKRGHLEFLDRREVNENIYDLERLHIKSKADTNCGKKFFIDKSAKNIVKKQNISFMIHQHNIYFSTTIQH